jgi:hypothetical protein
MQGEQLIPPVKVITTNRIRDVMSKGKGAMPVRATKRNTPPSDSSRSSGSEDEEEDDDKSAMLAALQAHSRAMFGLDGPDEAESSTQAQRRLSPTIDADEEEDEFQSDDGWGAEDGFVSDSEDGIDSEVEDESEIKMKAVEPARRVVEVVDSSIGRGGSLDVLSKAEKRAFLVCPLSNM